MVLYNNKIIIIIIGKVVLDDRAKIDRGALRDNTTHYNIIIITIIIGKVVVLVVVGVLILICCYTYSCC